MKTVIETATGKALYLFSDADEAIIADDGLSGVVRAMDILPSTHSIVATTQPEFWIGGGVLGWNGDWIILDQNRYDEATAPIVETPTPKEPTLWATAQMALEEGVLTSVLANWNWKIAGCFQLDIGLYYVSFSESLPDTDYIAKAWDGNLSCFVRREDQFVDSFIVSIKDVNGNPADPTTLNVEIIKST